MPPNVQRVFFKGQNTNHEVTWNQVKDITSLTEFVQSNYLKPNNNKATLAQLDPLNQENGIAEFNACKRKIIWKLRNVKGQQTKMLDVSLTYLPGHVIDEL